MLITSYSSPFSLFTLRGSFFTDTCHKIGRHYAGGTGPLKRAHFRFLILPKGLQEEMLSLV